MAKIKLKLWINDHIKSYIYNVLVWKHGKNFKQKLPKTVVSRFITKKWLMYSLRQKATVWDFVAVDTVLF